LGEKSIRKPQSRLEKRLEGEYFEKVWDSDWKRNRRGDDSPVLRRTGKGKISKGFKGTS